MKRYLTPVRATALVVLMALATGAWSCGASDQRKLIKAEDDAATLIGKLEQARTTALQSNTITKEQATAIDRLLLRTNRSVKHVSEATDAFNTAPNASNKQAVIAAIASLRAVLDEFKLAVNDGSLGIKNKDSQKAFTTFLTGLQGVATTVEGIIGSMRSN